MGQTYYVGVIPKQNHDIGLLLSRAANLLEENISFAYFVETILMDYDIKLKK